MILYRYILPIYYHLLLVVSGWLSRKWKNFEKSCGFYRSATISKAYWDMRQLARYYPMYDVTYSHK